MQSQSHSEQILNKPPKFTIAVASGKGGVGKSTVAVNLAFALQQLGLRVGLLDADIYGPSVPHMLGLKDQPESLDGVLMQPLIAHEVRCMSMGLLTGDQPAVWRGPMVMKAIKQMLFQVDWQGADVLVIDMPPGTGDAPLTLAQSAKLDGVVMVSTPQDLALIDCRKSWRMFQMLNIPLLGLIENMSHFACPHCGEHTAVFHHGGAKQAADTEGITFLGEIPLYLGLRESGDQASPFVVEHPDHELSARFKKIAEQVWGHLNAKENPGVRSVAQTA